MNQGEFDGTLEEKFDRLLPISDEGFTALMGILNEWVEQAQMTLGCIAGWISEE